jgi:hypothetical protein
VRSVLKRRIDAGKQPQVRLVHEIGRLQRPARPFVPQTCTGHPAELFIDDGE